MATTSARAARDARPPPTAIDSLVRRPRLYKLLDTVWSTSVFVVSAPAGYGKTMLATAWLTDRGIRECAWVDLTARHDRESEFWIAVIESLAAILPDDADPVLESITTLALRAPQEVPAKLARWIADRDTDVLFVLDDLHLVVDAAVHEQLVEFVVAVDRRVHLLVLTRHDPPWPLHRMRVDGIVSDLRADAMSFDEAETADLFARLGLSLSADQVTQLVSRTQGWVAGLRLAALGASRAADRDQFLESVSGGGGYIADYLMREVYESLPSEWQRLLSRVSVVDEVCPELADALTGSSDAAGRLSDLARRNAFVAEAGSRPGWFRLHPLLLDFLRSRATDRRQERASHRAAAIWFRSRDEPLLALEHACKAQQWAMASDLVGTYVVTWTVQRDPAELRRLLDGVPHEVVLTQPGLSLGAAAARSMMGDPAAAVDFVAAARGQLYRVTGRRRRRYGFLLAVISAGNERLLGDPGGALAGFRCLPTEPAVLGTLGMADWTMIRNLIVSNSGSSEYWTGERLAAKEHLSEAAAQPTGSSVAFPVRNARAHLSYLRWEDGDLTEAERLAREVVNEFAAQGLQTAVQGICAYLALAGVAIDRDELAAARQWLDLAEICVSEPHTALARGLQTARLLEAEGRAFDALAAVRLARHQSRSAPIPGPLAAEAAALETRLLCMADGHGTASARDAGDQSRTPVDPGALGTRRIRIESHLSRLAAALADDDDETALAALDAAFGDAAPETIRRPFLRADPRLHDLAATLVERGTSVPEFAADMLHRMSAHRARRPTRNATIFVPLTERESQILGYLATSLRAQEIARLLYVSLNTVKTHQRSIYRKLGAVGRREAVAHARELNLL